MILTVTLNPALDKVYHVDDFALNGVFRPAEITATAGGKGLNVARVARTLGEEVAAAGFLGGEVGKSIERKILGLGIESRFIHIAGESRTCLAIVDHKRGSSTEILEPGPEISREESEMFLESFSREVGKSEIIAASGSQPRGLPEDYYRTLIEIATQGQKKIILDTSGEYLKQGIRGLPFMIKPNQYEFEDLIGTELPTLKDKAKALLALAEEGITLPCVTLGRNGCIAVIDGRVYHFVQPEIKVINPVGSGDSFVAGCAVGLSRGYRFADAIRLGMACGIANTQFLGTGTVSVGMVTKFYDTVRCELIL